MSGLSRLDSDTCGVSDYIFAANMLIEPRHNWPVERAAKIVFSDDAEALRFFEPGANSGIGFSLAFPNKLQLLNITLKTLSSKGNGSVSPKLYVNKAREGWLGPYPVGIINFENTNLKIENLSFLPKNLHISPGDYVEFELVRDVNSKYDKLSGDWVLNSICVEFN